ncbi:MAG: hypothetical protein FWJ90_16600 [Actinomadura sp.]
MFEGCTGGEPMEVRDGLLATGDIGRLDHRGLLFVDGRADGLVVSGGGNVVPRDVHFIPEPPCNATGKVVHPRLTADPAGRRPEGRVGRPPPGAETG